MLDLYQELRSLIARLNEERIDYVLCGGLALAVYGISRATIDIDLLIHRESLARAMALAHGLEFSIKAKPMTFAGETIEIHRVSKPDPDTGDLLSLDFLVVTPGIQEVWNQRELRDWEEGEFWVVSRQGLIQLKNLRKSGQDLDDIRKLKTEKE